MDIVRTFGNIVSRQVALHPQRARRILLAGWRTQLLNLRVHPDKRLPPSRQYAAQVAMDKITRALRNPQNSAAVSLFVPFEPLEAAGVLPYCVEQLSCFIGGSKAEQAFLDIASQAGFSPTMCSYHRVFCGAFESGLLPTPRFIVYTTFACDANTITFSTLQRKTGIPAFCIDVPYGRDQAAIDYLAQQLRDMVRFVGDCLGTPVAEQALRQAVERSWQTALDYRRFLAASPGRRLPSDMTSEMYAFLINHLLLGTPEARRFNQMLADDMQQAPASDGLRLAWIHTMPFSQQPAIERLNFNDRVFIVASDMAADPLLIDIDPSRPYEAMARRLVLSCFNGPVQARIDRALDLARLTHADGCVIYDHWGCKATLGASRLMAQAIEQAGLPCLVLDGDGIDESNRSDGQTATMLDAFIELLQEKRA